MRLRIRRILGSLLILGMLLLPMVAPAAAQRGLQRDGSYESPQFGYTVTWGDDWDVRARDVISNRGGYDTLTLRGPLGTLLIQGQGAAVTPAEAVTKRVEIEGRGDNIIEQDLDGDVPMSKLLVGRRVILIEGRTLEANNAVVLAVLTAREKDFDAAMTSVREQVRFNDGPVLVGQERVEQETPPAETPVIPTEEASPTTPATAEPPSPAGTQVDLTGQRGDGTFESARYGFSFTYDPEVWGGVEDISSDGVEGLKLAAGTGGLVIFGWDVYGADPVACLDGEAAFYAGENPAVTNWEPAVDTSGEPIRYEADDYAYGVFTLTYADPDDPTPEDLVDYLECRQIPGEDAVVIIHGSAVPGVYNDHLDTVLDVAETIMFVKEAPDGGETPVAPQAGELPETGISGSVYTSPAYGFTIDIPAQWEVADEILARGDEQVWLTNGTSEVLIRATDAYTGDLAGCVDFAAENAPYDLELTTRADGRPFRGDDRNGAYGNYAYAGGAQAYVISCRSLVPGESVLIVAQDVPADELVAQRKFRIDLQQAIDLP